MNVSSRCVQHLVSVFIFSRSAYLSKLPNYKHSVFPISHIRFDIIQCIHWVMWALNFTVNIHSCQLINDTVGPFL